MPPNSRSRYRHSLGVRDTDGTRFLTRRLRFTFRDLAENRNHTVVQGDTLESIAARYFKGLVDRPAGLFWIVGDYQPTPVLDATIELVPGSNIVVPSRNAAQSIIQTAKRSTP